VNLRSVTLDDLTIEDERSLSHVALYARLKQALRRSGHRFLIPADGAALSWDRALFLNLTYWSGQPSTAAGSVGAGGSDAGADIRCDDHIAADEIGHIAWHCVVGRELARLAVVGAAGASAALSAEALFFSESIASAFDLYLIGRLLHHAPDSDFITTQVPRIADRAQDAGLSAAGFAALLEEIAREPERAFEDMRALLLDVANALLVCAGPQQAHSALDGFVGHRFEPLLHHFEISNWILYARAYGARAADATATAAALAPDLVVRRLDALLRAAPASLDWLAEHWIDADQTAPSQ
jgi:hypothetical protein